MSNGPGSINWIDTGLSQTVDLSIVSVTNLFTQEVGYYIQQGSIIPNSTNSNIGNDVVYAIVSAKTFDWKKLLISETTLVGSHSVKSYWDCPYSFYYDVYQWIFNSGLDFTFSTANIATPIGSPQVVENGEVIYPYVVDISKSPYHYSGDGPIYEQYTGNPQSSINNGGAFMEAPLICTQINPEYEGVGASPDISYTNGWVDTCDIIIDGNTVPAMYYHQDPMNVVCETNPLFAMSSWSSLYNFVPGMTKKEALAAFKAVWEAKFQSIGLGGPNPIFPYGPLDLCGPSDGEYGTVSPPYPVGDYLQSVNGGAYDLNLGTIALTVNNPAPDISEYSASVSSPSGSTGAASAIDLLTVNQAVFSRYLKLNVNASMSSPISTGDQYPHIYLGICQGPMWSGMEKYYLALLSAGPSTYGFNCFKVPYDWIAGGDQKVKIDLANPITSDSGVLGAFNPGAPIATGVGYGGIYDPGNYSWNTDYSMFGYGLVNGVQGNASCALVVDQPNANVTIDKMSFYSPGVIECRTTEDHNIDPQTLYDFTIFYDGLPLPIYLGAGTISYFIDSINSSKYYTAALTSDFSDYINIPNNEYVTCADITPSFNVDGNIINIELIAKCKVAGIDGRAGGGGLSVQYTTPINLKISGLVFWQGDAPYSGKLTFTPLETVLLYLLQLDLEGYPTDRTVLTAVAGGPLPGQSPTTIDVVNGVIPYGTEMVIKLTPEQWSINYPDSDTGDYPAIYTQTVESPDVSYYKSNAAAYANAQYESQGYDSYPAKYMLITNDQGQSIITEWSGWMAIRFSSESGDLSVAPDRNGAWNVGSDVLGNVNCCFRSNFSMIFATPKIDMNNDTYAVVDWGQVNEFSSYLPKVKFRDFKLTGYDPKAQSHPSGHPSWFALRDGSGKIDLYETTDMFCSVSKLFSLSQNAEYFGYCYDPSKAIHYFALASADGASLAFMRYDGLGNLIGSSTITGMINSGIKRPCIGMLNDYRIGVSYGNTLFESDDGGLTWTVLISPIFPRNYGESAFCVDSGSGLIFVAQGCGSPKLPSDTGGNFQLARFDGTLSSLSFPSVISTQTDNNGNIVSKTTYGTDNFPVNVVLFGAPQSDRLSVNMFEPHRLVVGIGSNFAYSDDSGASFYNSADESILASSTVGFGYGDGGNGSEAGESWTADGIAMYNGEEAA